MDLFELFEMRQALRVSVGHCVTAKDFVSANHKLEVERKLHEVAVLLGIHMIHFRRILTFFVLYVGPGLEPVFTLLIVGFLREKRWLHAPVEQTICLCEIADDDLNLAQEVRSISHPKRKPLQVSGTVGVRPHKHVELMGVLATNLFGVRTFEVDVEDNFDFFALVLILFFFHGTGAWLVGWGEIVVEAGRTSY